MSQGNRPVTLQVDVVGLTYTMFLNKHSDLLALGFLTGDDVIWTLGLLSVNTSGVDSIAASSVYPLGFLGIN